MILTNILQTQFRHIANGICEFSAMDSVHDSVGIPTGRSSFTATVQVTDEVHGRYELLRT